MNSVQYQNAVARPFDLIGPLQLRCMHIIWREFGGSATVHQVHDALNRDAATNKHAILAYTTILTVMRNLARRKVLDQKLAGRSHLFVATCTEIEYRTKVVKHILDSHFDGNINTFNTIALGLTGEPA